MYQRRPVRSSHRRRHNSSEHFQRIPVTKIGQISQALYGHVRLCDPSMDDDDETQTSFSVRLAKNKFVEYWRKNFAFHILLADR